MAMYANLSLTMPVQQVHASLTWSYCGRPDLISPTPAYAAVCFFTRDSSVGENPQPTLDLVLNVVKIVKNGQNFYLAHNGL